MNNFLRFVTKNQERTEFDIGGSIVKNTFDPDAVHKILLHYCRIKCSYESCVFTVEIFDKFGHMIAQCGRPAYEFAKERHVIQLEETERLVGVICSNPHAGFAGDL
jgi:hypothetical protein